MKQLIIKYYKIFIISFFYGIITYSLYFQAHYIHDSYRIYNFGFLQNLGGFWTQGRPFSMWFNMLFNFLNITPRFGQIISVFFTILFLAFSSVIIYSLITDITPKEYLKNIHIKRIIILISCFLFFNIYITDWMLFMESCVIALGCLLSMIGAYYIIKKQDYKKYIISSICFILGVFCYQASITIGGAITIAFILYNNKDKKFFSIIQKLILSMIPYILALVSNYIFIKLININNSSDIRLSGNIDLIHNALFVLKQIKWYFVDMFNYPTKYILALLIFITFIYYFIKMIKVNNKKITLLYTIISLFVLWFLSILPIMMMPSDSIYFISRNIPYIASFFPYMLLTIYIFNTGLFNKDYKIYYVLVIIYAIIITTSIIKVTAECLKNNQQDIFIATTIQNEINNYEQNTNNKIDTIILLPDNQISLSEANISYYSDNTVRAFSSNYGAKEIMYFVSQRYYNVIDGTIEQKNELFGNIQWNSFCIEQLKFNHNVLYLVNY